jgi:transposase
MQVVYPRCAGLDVHKLTVVASVMLTDSRGRVDKQTQTFGTTTEEVLKLGDWLRAFQVSHAAMESTGVYWKPVYNLLEGLFELLVVNAQHIKAVPGRKTDVMDSEWIADLLRHGLLRGSFIPPRPQRELRELVRHRTNVVQRRAQSVNELQKVLESANIKLAGVASDITGVSATEMLQGLLAGQTDPEVLAELARGKLKSKREALRKALRGDVREHHRLMLSQLLGDIGWCEEQVLEVSAEIARRLKDDQEVIDRLDEIPGVNERIAQIIVAEVGTNLEKFPTSKHLSSWAGMCPGNNQSGGKRRRGRIRPGNRSLKQALMEAANAAVRKKETYLQTLYGRLVGRRGRKRTLVAVGRTILESVYYMLKNGQHYRELGADYFERRNPEALARKLARRIQRLGFDISLTTLSKAA